MPPSSTSTLRPPIATPADAGSPTPTVEPTPVRIEAVVVGVVDGDTIRVEINGQPRVVRYIGIDCPEEDDPGDVASWLAEEATRANRRLVEGQTVLLEQDVSDTDRHGRLLRYVYLPSGGMVNELLVRSGHARAVRYPPDLRYAERLEQAQAKAQAAQLGLWGPPPPAPVATATLVSSSTPWPPTATPALMQPTATPLPSGVATGTPPPTQGANCDPSYPTVCIPPPPPDLDCADIPFRRFQVLPPDPHLFDGDGNGIGCESVPE